MQRVHYGLLTTAIVTGLMGFSNRASAELIIDWDIAPDRGLLSAGQIIDDEFAPFGITISAENANPHHPDLAVVFDTANPTGGDTDLQTPGYHPSNLVPLGNVLIIAESGGDLNNDGFLDVPPDDEASGGTVFFDLSFTATSLSVVLIDTEEAGGSIDFFLSEQLIGSVPIPATGDNAVQTVFADHYTFNEFHINLAGSGAIGPVTIVPAPGALALIGCCLGSARRRRG